MRICELRQKEVINTCTCRSLGYPVDAEFDCKTNRITALILPGPGQPPGKKRPEIHATLSSSLTIQKAAW